MKYILELLYEIQTDMWYQFLQVGYQIIDLFLL